MAFTNLLASNKQLYESSLVKSVNSRTINWAINCSDKNKITGEVFNIAFGLKNLDLNSLQTLDSIINSSTAMGAISNSSTAMTAVIASSTAMTAVAASSTAMAAVAASSTAMTAVIASSTAMTAIAASSTAMAAIAASSTACAAIKASPTAITALDNSSPIHIPKMTSNTAPSGVASASSYYNVGGISCPAYLSMNKELISVDTNWYAPAGYITNQWLQYKFTTPVWCYKVTLTNGNSTQPGCLPKNFKIQYSSDGITFYDAITNVTQNLNNTLQTFNVCAASGKNLYWRIFCIDTWISKDGFLGIGELDFFCK